MDIRSIYNKLAKNYNLRQSNPATEILRKKESNLIKEFASGLVLDLGCGTGFHLDLCKNIIGLDVSEKILKLAKRKNKPLIQASIENLPIKPNSVETVFCFYGTLNLVGLEKTIKEIQKVLKPNGKILLSATSYRDIDKHRSSKQKNIKKFRIENQFIQMQLFEKKEIVKVFEKSGFKLKHFDSVFKIQKPRWGNFQKFSFFEKFKLGIEKIFPKKLGRIYLFAFAKI